MKHLLSIIAIMTLLLSACSGEDHSNLKRADALMEEHPDSALSILQTIDSSNIPEGDLPYFALLMTQALIKNDVPVTSDSLISIAYGKYADDWRGDKGIRSNFYMGEILFNQEKNRDAMKYYLTAYEEAKRLDNHYWHAKAAERIADLFFLAYNLSDASKYRKEAITLYEASALPLYKIRAETRLDFMNENNGRITKHLQLQDSLLNHCYDLSNLDSLLLTSVNGNSMSPLLAVGKIYGLEFVSNILSAVITDREKLDGALLIANILRQENNYNESDSILLEAKKNVNSNEDKIKILYALYQNACNQDNLSIALSYADSIFLYQENITNNLMQETINGIHSEYYETKSIEHQQRSRIYLAIAIFVVLIGCLTSYYLWRLFSQKNKRQQAELDATIESVVSMKAYTDKINSEKALLQKEIKEKKETLADVTLNLNSKDLLIVGLQQKSDEQEMQLEDKRKLIELIQKEQEETNKRKNEILTNLFREKWKTLNMLCEEYYLNCSSQKMKESISRRIESEIKGLRSDENLHTIESEVNKYLGGIIDKLKDEFPSFKRKDIAFCTLLFAGFTPKAVCYILNIQNGNFYVKKGRLTKRIKESKSLFREKFLSLLK